MKNDNYNDDENNIKALDYFDELNNYISNLYNWFLVEKNEMVNIKNKHSKMLNENNYISKKIEDLQDKIDDIDKLNFNIKIDRYREYLDNCQESENAKMQILRSQEFERKRIARELHDTVIQNLTNLIHKSEIASKVIDTDIVRTKLEIFTISNSIKDIIEEMRSIIYNLRPMAFDDIGIDVVIERELLKFKEKGIKVNYSVMGDVKNIEQTILLTLLRIVQEACNNSIKYSMATSINVMLKFDEQYLEVIIEDDGIGFENSESSEINYETKSGFGLSMMKERVYLLSGKINIESNKDKGTKIQVIVPRVFRGEK